MPCKMTGAGMGGFCAAFVDEIASKGGSELEELYKRLKKYSQRLVHVDYEGCSYNNVSI